MGSRSKTVVVISFGCCGCVLKTYCRCLVRAGCRGFGEQPVTIFKVDFKSNSNKINSHLVKFGKFLKMNLKSCRSDAGNTSDVDLGEKLSKRQRQEKRQPA